MASKIVDLFTRRFVLFQLKVSTFTARVSDEAAAREYELAHKMAKGTIAATRKFLTGVPEFDACTTAYGRIKGPYHRRMLPFMVQTLATGGTKAVGPRMLSTTSIKSYMEEHNNLVAAAELSLARLKTVWVQAVSQQQALLGDRFDPSLYPSVAELDKSFSVELMGPRPIPAATNFDDVMMPPDILEMAKADMEAAVKRDLDSAMAHLQADLASQLGRVADIADKVTNEERTRVSNSLFTQLGELADNLVELGTGGANKELVKIGDRLRKVAAVDPARMRKVPDLARKVSVLAKGTAKELDNLNWF